MKLEIINDERTGRLKARTVNVAALSAEAAEKAAQTGKATVQVDHGGTVCNCYGYPAETEAALVVAVPGPDGVRVAVYATQIPANKATYGGAAEACLKGARAIFDERYGEGATKAAIKAVIAEAKADLDAA